MIDFENRFDEYAYRVASLPLDASVENLEEGQFITIKGGKIVLAGKDSPKSFLAMGSKREGRDQISGKFLKNVSFLVGNFMLSITNFDKTATYGDMTPLTADKGTVTAAVAPTDKIVAYAIGKPKNGHLRIVSA